MARKRLLSPEFFTHGALFDAEAASGLPLRLAFAGLWTASDRRGVFTWNPRVLKLAILPYDTVDFDAILGALRGAGFIEHYVVDGKEFGIIPSFGRWQSFHKNEKPSDAPNPPKSSIGRLEPEHGGISTPVVITGTVSSTSAVAGAVAEPSGAPAPTTELKAPNRVDRSTDQLEQFLNEHDFGAFRPAVEGLVRAARNPAAIIATFGMHLGGEAGHERATGSELGLACQQFLANGQSFNASFFAGFIRRAKQGIERTGNRRRNTAEASREEIEQRQRAAEVAEDRATDQLLEQFREQQPARYAALRNSAEASVPKTITFGRDVMVRSALVRLVKQERAA